MKTFCHFKNSSVQEFVVEHKLSFVFIPSQIGMMNFEVQLHFLSNLNLLYDERFGYLAIE